MARPADEWDALRYALDVIDRGAKKSSGNCPRCGKPRGGFLPLGMSKSEAGMCICEGDFLLSEDGKKARVQ